jgi:hypothetical protein
MSVVFVIHEQQRFTNVWKDLEQGEQLLLACSVGRY